MHAPGNFGLLKSYCKQIKAWKIDKNHTVHPLIEVDGMLACTAI